MPQAWAILMFLPLTLATLGQPPVITYFDGNDNMNQCATRLERRIIGKSGVIYSHSQYGRTAYNGSRNCFMMLVAPAGYKVRVKALEFDVNGHISECNRDTLHIFDHEDPVDPNVPFTPSLADTAAPGPILGQFCGRMTNLSEMGTSTHNALTLWWHSNANLPINHHAAGFKLLWTAYRNTDTGICSPTREFACGMSECIPIELACDHFGDCKDESDMLARSRQIAKCENIDLDPINSLTGPYVLLLSGGLVLIAICCCGAICLCCRDCKGTAPPVKGSTEMGRQQPSPPQFFPPSPPKIPPPSTTAYTPRRKPQYETSVPMTDGYRTVRMANEYGSPMDLQSEYTYVRNDIHRNLL